MKKLSKLLSVLAIMLLFSATSNAITFEEAYTQTDKKPMVALIYAQWADEDKTFLNTYRSIQEDFTNSYNFVELDIASKDAKFFNTKFHIYPNLPYILMFRDNGKVSRYIPKNCTEDAACIRNKLKSFIL